jgi:adenylate kinase
MLFEISIVWAIGKTVVNGVYLTEKSLTCSSPNSSQAIADNTAIGQKVKPVIEKGNLVDDATMVELVKDTIEHDFKNKGWLLDGFPRTLPQADQLDAMLQATGKPLHLALMLDVPDELIIDRICSML